MKHLIFILSILICGTAFGQQKNTKAPPPPPLIRPVPEPPPSYTQEEVETVQCFVYNTEEQKDSLVYVTERLLEYGGNGSIARMVITSYNYDQKQKLEADKKGTDIVVTTKQLQFINGKYKIENDVLTFTPNKEGQFEKKSFKLIYNKMHKPEYLKDENSNKYTPGDCPETIIGM